MWEGLQCVSFLPSLLDHLVRFGILFSNNIFFKFMFEVFSGVPFYKGPKAYGMVHGNGIH
jgi:hypothetical protein